MKTRKVVLLFYLLFSSILGNSQEKELKEKILNIRQEILNLEKEKLAKKYYQLGYYYKKDNNIDSAYKYFDASKKEYEALGDSIKIAEKLFSLAKIESEIELFFKSDSTAIKALKYLGNNKGKYSLTTSLYNTLGINANSKENYKNAIYWYTKAMEFAKDSIKKYRYESNIANNYISLKEYKSAIKIYENLLLSLEPYTDNSIGLNLKAKALDNYNYARLLNGDEVNEDDFLKTQKLKKQTKDFRALASNYFYLYVYYEKMNIPDTAQKYAYLMYDLASKYEMPKYIILGIDKILLSSKPTKLQKLALERIKLQDSITVSKRKLRNKFATYMYSYEEEKKQKLEARAKLAESNLSLEQQKSQKQLLWFVVIFTILSSIVYFFYKREKNKKEKAIEVYNTETRLAKKIHDELANDVYAVMNTLYNTSTTDARLLTRIEEIYAQTRNISHENSPILTGEHFEDFLKQLFIDFTSDHCKVIHKGLLEVNINQLAKEKQIVVYRVLQELLVNMKKYSEATLVLVTFSVEKNKLSVAYQDNGKGVENLSVKNGLQNMEIRIKSVGGFITFESKQEKGFKAKFQFKK
ncbi:ATP-binding protein [Tenacibaculum sp. 47A_GOM-205m]|uniref:tetratricopeptide repeat-containing sensor histidine kinase n=1 Tax=Tenacibaculum sp. 47A_GOM-205m TaxID=1380384 RepID=UPI00048AE4CD|nr:ATP-binding protein [Tenacibaculum sp. 47A_GOM-205m]